MKGLIGCAAPKSRLSAQLETARARIILGPPRIEAVHVLALAACTDFTTYTAPTYLLCPKLLTHHRAGIHIYTYKLLTYLRSAVHRKLKAKSIKSSRTPVGQSAF